MKKNVYMTPKFGFQELRLLERVADTCWGKAHYAWYDENKNGKLDGDEQKFYIQGTSCDDAKTKLEGLLLEAGITFEGKDTKQNVSSDVIRPIYS